LKKRKARSARLLTGKKIYNTKRRREKDLAFVSQKEKRKKKKERGLSIYSEIGDHPAAQHRGREKSKPVS